MTTNSNSAIAPVSFDFNSNAIRIATDETGEPLFCAKDVCKVLGYKNESQTVADHCRQAGVSKRYLGVVTGKTKKGDDAVQQIEATFINEGNLYRLIIKSRKPEAEPFEAWVCDEVLPTIRKTGRYEQQSTIPLQLPEPPTITKAQQGELFTLVANKARSSGKKNAYYWSRYQNHFHLSSYKLTPADKFDEARDYLDRLEGDNNPLLTLSQEELDDRVAKCVEAMRGELLPKQENTPTDTITISLNQGIKMMTLVFGGTADTIQRYSVSVDKEFLSIHQMDNKLMADVLKDQGYIVFDKTGVSARQMVMHHIPPQFLPDMIEEAWAMLRRIEAGKKLD